MTPIGVAGGWVLVSDDEKTKKTEAFLVRVEKDVHDFYAAEAKRRRVPLAHVVREVLYREYDKVKGVGNG